MSFEVETITASPFEFQIKRREVLMPQMLDFPTCYVCRSVDLEIISNEEFGPMTMCCECGYSWIATYEDLSSDIRINVAS